MRFIYLVKAEDLNNVEHVLFASLDQEKARDVLEDERNDLYSTWLDSEVLTQENDKHLPKIRP